MSDLSKISISNLSIQVFYDVKSRSSFCWKYFGHLVRTDGNKKKILSHDQVYCSACLDVVKRDTEDITFGSVKIKCYNKTVSTGNLTRHLRDDHQIRENGGGVEKSVKGPHKTEQDKWLMTKDMCLWFCKSLLPLDSLCDQSMMDFFKKYNIIMNEADIPTPSTLRLALSNIYEKMLASVKETISMDDAQHFAMAFDSWRDQYRRLNFITFKLHYLTPEFTLKAFTLSTEIMSEDRTVKEINHAVEDIKERFLLDGNEIIAVTDGGDNVKQAVGKAYMNHHLCLGNGLHNLVTIDGINSIQDISELVHKCKKIVKTIGYHSQKIQDTMENIKKVQLQFLNRVGEVIESLECDENDPVPQVDLMKNAERDLEGKFLEHYEPKTPTRWHVVLKMLQSVMSAYKREHINNILREIDQKQLVINQTEWILIQDLVTFLGCFKEATEILSSQTTCTLNVALVFRSEIIDILNSQQNDKSKIILHLKRNMMENINKRFPVTKPIVAAALLDGRFKNLKEIDIFLESQNVSRSAFLSSYVKEVINISDLTETDAGNLSDTLLQKLSKKYSYTACDDDPIDRECWLYLAEADPSEIMNGDLLSYWNKKKIAFPHLASLAKVLLCVPATTTSSERMFSVVGLSLTAKKYQLNSTKMNKIIFIHDNYKTCNIDEKN